MNTIHLDAQGKTARVLFQSLPRLRPKPAIRLLTKCGVVSPIRILNGLDANVDPAKLTPQEIISADPELAPSGAGEILDLEFLTAAYFDPESETPSAVSDFKQIDIIYDAAGQEKERRPHITRKCNLDELMPIKIGKRLSLAEALTGFVIKQVYQIVHEDGVQKDFLFGIARELHEKQEVAVLGAGTKGTLPLVVRDKGSPYRAFLYGEIGTGPDEGKYKLLLLLSDQELKRPAVAETEAAS
jgi:hypothetical protein